MFYHLVYIVLFISIGLQIVNDKWRVRTFIKQT